MNIKVINKSENSLPQYETPSSAGMDLRADFSKISITNPLKTFGDSEMVFKSEANKVTLLRLDPGARAMIPTGLFIALPVGYEAQIRPRSGLALKKGITVLNTPGTIDADFRGEICIILINQGFETVWIENKERIAQIVFNKVETVSWEEVNFLDSTERKGGFGHTGTK